MSILHVYFKVMFIIINKVTAKVVLKYRHIKMKSVSHFITQGAYKIFLKIGNVLQDTNE